jgi:hypothetical protein
MANLTNIKIHKTILRDFLPTLGLDAHVLQEHPDIIWQHLDHSLQLVSEEIININRPCHVESWTDCDACRGMRLFLFANKF